MPDDYVHVLIITPCRLFFCMLTLLERLWDKRVVPENEFEESEDEETNALHGVRYSKSVRSGRVKDSDGSSQPGAPRGARVRGTVDHLPAAATKLSSNGQNGVVKESSNNTHTSGDTTPAPTAPAPASAPAEMKVPEPIVTVVVPEVTVEKDGDTVMASAPDASGSKPGASDATPGSSQQDTDMTDASASS
jgi:hypothetical protein